MASPSAVLRNHVKTLTRKHESFVAERDWLNYVYTTFTIDASCCIAYIRKFRFQNTCIYTVQEFGERVSSRYVAAACNIAVTETDLQHADLGPTTLEQALIDIDDNAYISQFLVSYTSSKGDIIIRYTDTRTMKATFKDFENRVSSIIDLVCFNWDRSLLLELDRSRNSPDIYIRDGSFNADNVYRLYQNSTTGLNHALTTAGKALLAAQSTSTKIEEQNQKLGHLNEETFRQRLCDEVGIPWAKSLAFDTLLEIVEWTGRKIKASREERGKALRDIVRLCVGEFDGFKQANENFNWYKMAPYSRLYYYLVCAHLAKGFAKHGFSQRGGDFLKSMERCKKSIPFDQDPQSMRATITWSLLYEDTSLTLAVFLMLIDPEAYEPKKEKAFRFWQWPKTQYEFDHQGQFTELSGDIYVYSGAETKLSYTMVHYAREQLEERVRLLDGVMNLGYGKRTMFSLRVFVPTLGFGTKTKLTKNIEVIRRNNRYEVENKAVQTNLGDGRDELNDVSDAAQGENQDVEGEKETAFLLPERIDYIVKIESLS